MSTLLALAVGTLASEDVACLTAALLVQQGAVGVVPAVIACSAGIFIGDVGLWALGRVSGRTAAGWTWWAHRLDGRQWAEIRARLRSNAARAILASRFLPGTRLPLYVLAGVLGVPGHTFAFWSFVAAAIWTPGVIGFALAAGEAAAGAGIARGGWWALAVSTAVLLVIRGLRRLVRGETRRHAAARLLRWRRWEFWPMWLFYAPVAAWVALLALRYRGLTTITAANPGMPDGGTVGESKSAILQRLPPDAVIPFAAVETGDSGGRVRAVLERMERDGWNFPIVAKPDVGQRGAGVKLLRSARDLEDYLSTERGRVLVQPYHPGPFEAGVFYYRMPQWAKGRILSITDKQFPVVVGDGGSTLEQLVLAHPRYRMQARMFLRRFGTMAGRIPGAGERVQLAVAGNHAQGTMFRDGSHLWTPALERRIDDIARSYEGFFVGRFDVRYSEVEAFKAGRDLAIVELNGATAEATDIYDPSRRLVDAYRRLFRQWQLVFAIGAANRAAGAAVTPGRRLVALVREHLARRVAFEISD